MTKQAIVDNVVIPILDRSGGDKLPEGTIADLVALTGSTRQGCKNMASISRKRWAEGVSVSIDKPDTKTETVGYKKNFVFSAINPETRAVFSIEEYCIYHRFEFDKVHSYKLVSHTGIPYYNIAFKETTIEDEDINIEELKAVLARELNTNSVVSVKTPHKSDREAVLKWADLHLGAHIRNLLLTKDYDSDILMKGLLTSVEEVNVYGFKKVHVHINGDLIESFSGLNHINSWMSMNKDQIGANAIKLCTDILHKAFSKINNLGLIQIVAGNHDRTSKANDEDVKGGAADLIAWGLQLMGYNVEFHPYITTHLVEGINHVNLHGEKGISKRSTKDIIWDYGIKGKYNFVFEAHLHSLIEKLSASARDKFKVIRDDAIDHRRMHLQPFFTGNYYSETLGFNSNAGYCIVWDNGRGLPQVFNGCV